VRHPETPRHVLFLGHITERKDAPELLLMSRRWRATLPTGDNDAPRPDSLMTLARSPPETSFRLV
jgi:hypothetical protein